MLLGPTALLERLLMPSSSPEAFLLQMETLVGIDDD